MRALVVGSIHLDWILRVPALPAPGDTVLSTSRTTASGGKGANQAVALRRLGVAVQLVGAVGDDAEGGRLLEALAAAGVGTAHVRVCEGQPSGVAIVAVDADGDNGIIVAAGASGMLAPADVAGAERALEGAAVVLLQLEVPLETVAAAVAAARSCGVPVVLNAAPARPLPDGLLSALDVLVVNESEGVELAGAVGDPEAVARTLLARGPGAVVVTLGGRGALVADRHGVTTIPAHAVEEVVDTTGAGDTFVAAIAAGVGAGHDVRESARLAAAAAALAVQLPGAQSAPTLAEAQALLDA